MLLGQLFDALDMNNLTFITVLKIFLFHFFCKTVTNMAEISMTGEL